jgi:hypothetical protein
MSANTAIPLTWRIAWSFPRVSSTECLLDLLMIPLVVTRFFLSRGSWCQMCGSRISLIRCKMKVGGTYGTVITYQKVGAKAGKKEAGEGKIKQRLKAEFVGKAFAYDPKGRTF